MLRRRNHVTNPCLQSTVDVALEIYRQLTLELRGRSLLGIDFVEFPGPRDRLRVALILGISRVAKCRALALNDRGSWFANSPARYKSVPSTSGFCKRQLPQDLPLRSGSGPYTFQALAGAEAGLKPTTDVRHTEPEVAKVNTVTQADHPPARVAATDVHGRGTLRMRFQFGRYRKRTQPEPSCKPRTTCSAA
jgi:hypothetical protein